MPQIKDILSECLLQRFLYGYAIILNVFIFALICSMATLLRERRLLYVFSFLFGEANTV